MANQSLSLGTMQIALLQMLNLGRLVTRYSFVLRAGVAWTDFWFSSMAFEPEIEIVGWL